MSAVSARQLRNAIVRQVVLSNELENMWLNAEQSTREELSRSSKLRTENTALRADVAALTLIIHSLCDNRAEGRRMAKAIDSCAHAIAEECGKSISMYSRLRKVALGVATRGGCRKKMSEAIDRLEKGYVK